MFKFNSKHVASLYAIVIFSLIGLDFGSTYPEYEFGELAIPATMTAAMLIMLGFEFKDFKERLTISAYGSIVFGLGAATTTVYDHEFAYTPWLMAPIFAVVYTITAALFLGTALVCGRQLKKFTDRRLKDRFAPHRRT